MNMKELLLSLLYTLLIIVVIILIIGFFVLLSTYFGQDFAICTGIFIFIWFVIHGIRAIKNY